MSLKKIIRTIEENKRFLISTHVNSDADGLCSELIMSIYLKSIGKKVFIINEDDPPERLKFLSGVKQIKSYKENQRISYDVAILLDCGTLKRIGKVRNLIREEKILINIDHHISNNLYGNLNLVKPQCSSTTEILYGFLKSAGCRFTKELATYLYTGILTDTGCFRYENTTADTHKVVGELLEFGVPAYSLYKNIYEMVSVDDLRMFTKIVENFESLFDGKVIFMELNKLILSKFSDQFDLKDTIFKFLRFIKGVELIVIFSEIEVDKTRVNLRSPGKFDVSRIASFFNGGGHKQASGCSIKEDIKGSRKKILRKIREKFT